MHPSERPPDIRAFHDLLFGSLPESDHLRAPAPPLPEASWREILVQNRYLIISAAALLALAIYLSL